jgi:hypothetical protein
VGTDGVVGTDRLSNSRGVVGTDRMYNLMHAIGIKIN